jgi:carbonic anhydrase/acetyltransferase-like protein (isoleucine patch superfamily)
MMRRVGNVTLAFNAVVTADVTLGDGVSLWPGAVVRGDVAKVTIGPGTNVQDNAVIHCDFGSPNTIGANVVIGHAAVVHGVSVGDNTLIGIGARLLGGSVIGDECLIAAGAVVPPNAVIPPRSVVMGVPGKVVRGITEAELALTRTLAERYMRLAAEYADGLMSYPYGEPR